jgi:hypothetical protein
MECVRILLTMDKSSETLSADAAVCFCKAIMLSRTSQNSRDLCTRPSAVCATNVRSSAGAALTDMLQKINAGRDSCKLGR